MALVTLDMFKDHLRITGSADDADLQLKLDVAEALVLDYVDQRQGSPDADEWSAEVAAWTSATAPSQVLAAILIMGTELYRFRGDDTGPDHPQRELGELPRLVTALLYRFRDPAVS